MRGVCICMFVQQSVVQFLLRRGINWRAKNELVRILCT